MREKEGKWDFDELLTMVESECRACGWKGFVKDPFCPKCSEPVYIVGDGKMEWGDKESVTVYYPVH